MKKLAKIFIVKTPIATCFISVCCFLIIFLLGNEPCIINKENIVLNPVELTLNNVLWNYGADYNESSSIESVYIVNDERIDLDYYIYKGKLYVEYSNCINPNQDIEVVIKYQNKTILEELFRIL